MKSKLNHGRMSCAEPLTPGPSPAEFSKDVGEGRGAQSRAGLTLLELVMVVSILAVLTAMVVPGMSNRQEDTRKTVATASINSLRNTIANKYLQEMSDLPRGAATEAGSSGRAFETVGGDERCLPQLHFLFVNPNSYNVSATPPYTALNDFDNTTNLGWNGPYVMTTPGKYPNPDDQRSTKNPNDTRQWGADFGFTAAHGEPGDQTVMDPWGSPIIIKTVDYMHGSAAMRSEYLVSAGPNLKLDNWTTNTDNSLNTQDDIVALIRTIPDPNP